ncbi:DMT family transporter [Asaia prunellae]|uniref:DMT family transporter n=1 Tax=Asaia prunellae TaxID=610245 RepID=UPI001FB1295E|nr:DMT family transporter [Asaia prunellae]
MRCRCRCLWGLVFLAPELARDFPPLDLASGRYLAYGLIALMLVGTRLPALCHNLQSRDWHTLFWLSFFGNSFYYVMLSMAVQKGGIALTSLVIGFMPVAVTIIGSRDKDAPHFLKLAPSLFFCMIGAFCIGWQALFHTGQPPSDTGSSSLLGLFCACAALVSWTGFAVGNSRALSRLTHISAHDWNLLTGLITGAQAVIMLPLALILEPGTHDIGAWGRFAAVSIGVAVIASLCGNALWNRMSQLLPLTLTGQMILFETLFALLYGFLWDRRMPHPLEIASFLFIVASVLCCVAAHRKPSQPAGDTRLS